MKNLIFFKKLLPLLLIFIAGVLIGYGYFTKTYHPLTQNINKNKYSAFLGEVYDKIKDNYWEMVTDDQIINLYQLGIQKFSPGAMVDKPHNKEELIKSIEIVLKGMDENKKKEF